MKKAEVHFRGDEVHIQVTSTADSAEFANALKRKAVMYGRKGLDAIAEVKETTHGTLVFDIVLSPSGSKKAADEAPAEKPAAPAA